MAWTAPAIRSTGDLVTASIWNTDIGDNLKYLKGQSGAITLEDDAIPDAADTLDIGSADLRWAQIHGLRIYSGNQFCVHKGIREQLTVWEDDTSVNYQALIATGGAGTSFALGGIGQAVLSKNCNQAGTVYVANPAEQNNAYDMSFNTSRKPYLRIECAIVSISGDTVWFMGWRATRTGTAIPGLAEASAGIIYDPGNGVFWYTTIGDGISSTKTLVSLGAGRHVVEILIATGNETRFFLDGELDTVHAEAPAAATDVDWQVLWGSDGTGAGVAERLTLGGIYAQENLA